MSAAQPLAGVGEQEEISAWFAAALLDWSRRHGRKDLPWQRDPTPYRVWVSEIMLQQTQVATVIPYYLRFVDRFPSAAALAAAPVDEALQLWSGLGYYARARNLHRAAVLVCERHGGDLPDTIDELQALPGIGRSTAGAILALARQRRHAILDGNVKRVLARFHAVAGWPGRPAVARQLWELAEIHTPAADVAAYTQAIMDLGATLCTRGQPDCRRCPVAARCRGLASGRAGDFPSPKPRAERPEREAVLLLLSNRSGELLLEKRPPSGIWGGLWSLPEAPAALAADDAALGRWCREQLDLRIGGARRLPAITHAFSHFTLNIRPVHARVTMTGGGVMEAGKYLWYNAKQERSHGMAAPIRRLIEGLQEDY